jgi:hypothetical protein
MPVYTYIIKELESNRKVFENLLELVPEEMIQWKGKSNRWSLLEIVCHLYDEEKEDFRSRLKSVLKDPEKGFSPIDPEGWVAKKKYADQDYDLMLFKFLKQRKISIEYLRTLKNPSWKNAHKHASLGELSAELFLANWLAHDHLHIRQIVKLKYDFLKEISEQDLSYAGNW